jgi:hypothetical protein
VRFIDYWSANVETFYMLYVYRKNRQGDLNATQIRAIAHLVRKEFK